MKHAMQALLLICIWGGAAVAEAATYMVEILVFAREHADTSEYFPVEPGLPDYAGVPTLDELGQHMLDPGNGRLGPEKYTLRQSRDYEPVFHGLWRQPAGSRQSPQKVRISSGVDTPDTPPMIEGVVGLGRGRYIHLDIDLVMRGPRIPVSPEQFQAGETGVRYQRYRLIAERKMGVNRLHYIDHPKMGVLVRVYR